MDGGMLTLWGPLELGQPDSSCAAVDSRAAALFHRQLPSIWPAHPSMSCVQKLGTSPLAWKQPPTSGQLKRDKLVLEFSSFRPVFSL